MCRAALFCGSGCVLEDDGRGVRAPAGAVARDLRAGRRGRPVGVAMAAGRPHVCRRVVGVQSRPRLRVGLAVLCAPPHAGALRLLAGDHDRAHHGDVHLADQRVLRLLLRRVDAPLGAGRLDSPPMAPAPPPAARGDLGGLQRRRARAGRARWERCVAQRGERRVSGARRACGHAAAARGARGGRC